MIFCKLVRLNVELSYRMRNQLLRARLFEFGHSLNEAWQSKRQFSSKISNSRLDQIYDEARQNGAIGAPSCSARAAASSLLHPYKHDLMAYLRGRGLNVRPFRFSEAGWPARLDCATQKSHGTGKHT